MPQATATAITAGQPQRRKRMRTPVTPHGWLTSADLIQRGLFGSTASLDRACTRPVSENPFPKAARDAITNTRFWRVEEIDAWVERERARVAARLIMTDAQRVGAMS